MSRLSGLTGVATFVLVTWAGAADAHIVAARLGDFYAGALHPLTDLQDILLWAGVGLLAGSMGSAQGRWLMLVVPAGLSVGLVGALSFGIGTLGSVANAAMMVVIGVLIAAGIRLPTALLCVMAFGLAVVRGIVNAEGAAPNTDLVLFAAGLATVGYAAITLIMALTVTFRGSDPDRSPSWRGIAIRVCGSWIAAIGLMMGGLALAL